MDLTETSNNSNESITLSDEKIKKYKKRIEEAEDAWDYLSVAKDISYEGDKNWAREIFYKAETLFEDISDFSSMAEDVLDPDYLGDKKYALKLYKKAEKLVKNGYEIRNLADSICNQNYLGDKEYALKLYKKAEEILDHNYRDILDLASSVFEFLEDKDYGKKLFKKAEGLLFEPTDFIEAAKIAACETYLNDKDHAIKLLNKAESGGSDNPKTLAHIGTTYAYDLNDNTRAKNMFEKCEALIDSLDEEDFMIRKYINLAYDVNRCNDRDYAKKLYMKAESLIASGGWDSSELVGYLEGFDEEWSKNVKKGNYGFQGTLN